MGRGICNKDVDSEKYGFANPTSNCNSQPVLSITERMFFRLFFSDLFCMRSERMEFLVEKCSSLYKIMI